MMVDQGDGDVSLSGLTTQLPRHDPPRAARHRRRRGRAARVAASTSCSSRSGPSSSPTPRSTSTRPREDLAEIAILSADTARLFDIKPRVAMISFSNFGNTRHPLADKVREAVEIVRQRRPELECDGEMQADTAVLPGFLQEHYPFARLTGPANVLVFPELQSANAAYKLVWRLANADAIGPILMGMRGPDPRPPAGRRRHRHRQHGRLRRGRRAGAGRRLMDYASGLKKEVAEIKFLIHDLRVRVVLQRGHPLPRHRQHRPRDLRRRPGAGPPRADLAELKAKAVRSAARFQEYSGRRQELLAGQDRAPRRQGSTSTAIWDLCELILNPLWGRIDKVLSFLPPESRSVRSRSHYRNCLRWICGVYYRLEHFRDEQEGQGRPRGVRRRLRTSRTSLGTSSTAT